MARGEASQQQDRDPGPHGDRKDQVCREHIQEKAPDEEFAHTTRAPYMVLVCHMKKDSQEEEPMQDMVAFERFGRLMATWTREEQGSSIGGRWITGGIFHRRHWTICILSCTKIKS